MRALRFGFLVLILLSVTSAATAQKLPSQNLPYISGGGPGVLLVDAEGGVTFFQTNRREGPVTLELPAKAVQTAATYNSAFVLLEDGTVMGWGSPDDVPGLSRDAATPAGTRQPVMPRPRVVSGLRDIVQIDAASHHGVALKNDGTVLAWGSGGFGLRGYGEESKQGLGDVSRVPGLTDVVAVATANEHSLALTRDGRVFAWGANGRGQLAAGVTGPPRASAPVAGLEDVVAIAAGGTTSLALTRDGSLWGWGSNQSAMLGNGTKAGSADEPGGSVTAPQRIKIAQKVRELAAGDGHVLVVTADGAMWAWGFDGYGQTGVGTSGSYQLKPVKIAAPANVRRVLATNYRSFAIGADGSVWHWGGAIPPGHLDTDSRKRPVQISPVQASPAQVK